MNNQLDITAIQKKRQYKLRGVFLSFQPINAYLGKVFISKGQGSKKKIYVFTTLGKLSDEFKQMKPQYRVKVWFSIKCKEYKGNWFTELIIESYEQWLVNEDKVLAAAKQMQLESDKLYSQSIYKNNG